MSFFNIVPRDEGFLSDMSNSVPLRVVRKDGVDVSPDININVDDLSKGYNNYYNTSSTNDNFNITILIKKTDKVKDTPLNEWLDKYIRAMTPFYINTDAIDINDDGNAFIIIKNPSRKQTNDKFTLWDLEFKKYTPVNVYKYANDNTGVQQAIKNAGKKKASTKTVKNAKLRKCSYKVLKYSKKKKVVACVKYMQKVLVRNKCGLTKKQIDGWYGKETVKAVKKFQKKWNKKHTKVTKGYTGIKVTQGTLVKNTNNSLIDLTGLNNLNINTKQSSNKSTVIKSSSILPVNGKVDKDTWKALCQS